MSRRFMRAMVVPTLATVVFLTAALAQDDLGHWERASIVGGALCWFAWHWGLYCFAFRRATPRPEGEIRMMGPVAAAILLAMCTVLVGIWITTAIVNHSELMWIAIGVLAWVTAFGWGAYLHGIVRRRRERSRGSAADDSG